jgi:hypothetical protein
MNPVQPASSKSWMNRNENSTSGRNSAKKSGHFSTSDPSGARLWKTLATSNMAARNPKSAIRYQCTPTRHLRHRLSSSRTPALPLVAAVTSKAGSAMPRIEAIARTALKASPSERSIGKASSPRPWRTTGRKTVHVEA